jgi:hypothetical protein
VLLRLAARLHDAAEHLAPPEPAASPLPTEDCRTLLRLGFEPVADAASRREAA